MPYVNPKPCTLSELHLSISSQLRYSRHARIAASAFVLLFLAGFTIASGQTKKVIVTSRALHPIYLPDLAIKNGSISVNPAYSRLSAKQTPELFATMIIANVGRGPAVFRHRKIYVQVGELATAVYCWCSKPEPVPISALAPGASFALKLAIYHDPHGEYECGPHKFEFAVDQDIDPSRHLGNRMNEVTDANNSFGPVYITIPKNLCLPPHLRKPSSLVNGVVRTEKISAQVKKPAPSQAEHRGQPKPAKPSTANKTVVIHKIGLAPRTTHTTTIALPAVQLPPGWSTVGGLLRASRPGLRLRLSGGHTLFSELGTGGRLSYELLDATGRVVKRVSAEATIRLLDGGALMLRDTTAHRQVLLGRLAPPLVRSGARP